MVSTSKMRDSERICIRHVNGSNESIHAVDEGGITAIVKISSIQREESLAWPGFLLKMLRHEELTAR